MNHLQLILLINALFSLSTGLSLILFRMTIAKWFGQQKQTVFWIVGLGLLFFSSLVFVQAITPEPRVVLFIIALDFIWVVASAIFLLLRSFQIASLGNKLVASVALIVLLLAVGQTFELLKIGRVSTTDFKQDKAYLAQPQVEFKQEGIFEGAFSHGNFTDNISLEIKKDATNWQVFFTSLEQNAFQIPATEVEVVMDSVNFKLISDSHTYDFKNKWSNDSAQLSGVLKVDSLLVTYILNRQKSGILNGIKTEEIYFQSRGLKLGGTIWRPKKSNNRALIFITSSGGSDRSGSRAEAIYFANKGFTTFHYDKRGTGISEGDWQSAAMNKLLSDDINAVKYFSKQTGIPLSQIGVKGSSQGATKIPYILNELEDLSFGIAVSCPGSTLLESDLNYWKNRNREALGNNLEYATQMQQKVFEHIAGKISRTELEKAIQEERSKPWFSSIWVPNLDEVQIDEKLAFSPIPHFEKIRQPLLIIQGTADEIIPLDSHQIISDALNNAQNKTHNVILLEEANHSMYNVGKSDFPYWAKLHDRYFQTMEGWIDLTFFN